MEETYKIMYNDISKLKFDAHCQDVIWWTSLMNYIYTKLNKSAIYVGGGYNYYGILR